MKPKFLVFSFFITSLFLLLTSCESATTTYDTDIIGTWKQDSWVITANNQPINRKMDFTFDAEKRYTVDYGTETEKGDYWFVDENLFTQEDGQQKKKVKILQLNPDTLVFEMNRGGQIEQVSYLR